MKSNEDTNVIIVGCMRSGTTFLANVLSNSGFYADQSKINPSTYEHSMMEKTNRQIFKEQKLNWHNPDDVEAWSVRFFGDKDKKIPIYLENRQRIRKLKRRLDGKSSILKDPKSSLTLPVWLNWLEDMSNLRVIWCIRHPQDVFHSHVSFSDKLKSKNVGIHTQYSMYSVDEVKRKWRAYNQCIESTLSQYDTVPHIVVDHRHWITSKDEQSQAISEFVGKPVGDAVNSLYLTPRIKTNPDLYPHRDDQFSRYYEELSLLSPISPEFPEFPLFLS